MGKMSRLLFLFGIFSVLFSACQEDGPQPVLPEGEDFYEGPQKLITLQQETEDFHYAKFVCAISTEDGTVISGKENICVWMANLFLRSMSD